MTVKNIPAELELHLKQLQTYLKDENWQATIDLCGRISAVCQQQLELPSNNFPGIVYVEQGDKLLQEKQIADAIAFYQRALSINPRLVIAKEKLASALSTYKHQLTSEGKLEEAIAIYQQILELNPDIAEIHASLGNLYVKIERWEEAISAYKRAIALNPQLAKAYFNVGTVYTKLGQKELAAEYWYQAASLNPNLLKAQEYLNLGNLLVSLAKYDGAIDCLTRAIHLEPNSTIAYISLGELFLQQNRVDDAIAVCQKLSFQNPKSAEGQILLEKALSQKEQYSDLG